MRNHLSISLRCHRPACALFSALRQCQRLLDESYTRAAWAHGSVTAWVCNVIKVFSSPDDVCKESPTCWQSRWMKNLNWIDLFQNRFSFGHKFNMCLFFFLLRDQKKQIITTNYVSFMTKTNISADSFLPAYATSCNHNSLTYWQSILWMLKIK